VERFFNKVPCKELAERFGVKENTIICIYKQAVEQLEKMIRAMDARREGLKATKSYHFTDDQKFSFWSPSSGSMRWKSQRCSARTANW